MDRRSPQEEMMNTWDLIAKCLTEEGWSFRRSEGYVLDELCHTCKNHKYLKDFL